MIIGAITVQMVNYLFGIERASELFFCYKKMFSDIAVAFGTRMGWQIDKAVTVLNANMPMLRRRGVLKTILAVAGKGAVLLASVGCIDRFTALRTNDSISWHHNLLSYGVKPRAIPVVAGHFVLFSTGVIVAQMVGFV